MNTNSSSSSSSSSSNGSSKSRSIIIIIITNYMQHVHSTTFIKSSSSSMCAPLDAAHHFSAMFQPGCCLGEFISRTSPAQTLHAATPLCPELSAVVMLSSFNAQDHALPNTL
jgi:hypothetical protein